MRTLTSFHSIDEKNAPFFIIFFKTFDFFAKKAGWLDSFVS